MWGIMNSFRSLANVAQRPSAGRDGYREELSGSDGAVRGPPSGRRLHASPATQQLATRSILLEEFTKSYTPCQLTMSCLYRSAPDDRRRVGRRS